MSFKNVLFKVMLALIIILGVIYLLFEKGDAASDKPDKKESVAAESTTKSHKKGKEDDKKNSEKTVDAKTKEKEGASAKAKKEKAAKEKKEKEKETRAKAEKEKKEKEARAKAEKERKEKAAKEKAAKKENLNSGKISSILSDSLVTASNGYFEVTKREPVRVFAEDITNGFGMQTLASYNLWGHNVGECTYNVAKLKKCGGKVLHMYAGLENGGSGTVKVEVFMDKTTDKSPDYTFEINAETVPGQMDIDIANAGSMTIRVDNQSGSSNNVAFYGMSLS